MRVALRVSSASGSPEGTTDGRGVQSSCAHPHSETAGWADLGVPPPCLALVARRNYSSCGSHAG